MKGIIFRKSVVIVIAVICITIFGCIANAFYTDTISFGPNPSKGFASSSYYCNDTASKYRAQLIAVNYIGMPSGLMPNGAKVNFRLYKPTKIKKASELTSFTYNDMISGSWHDGGFLTGIVHNSTTKFYMASGTNASIGATVSVKWYFYP